jgi:hypothetical protein
MEWRETDGKNHTVFNEAHAMVLASSQALPGIPVLGWDVLLTENGPVILEANTGLSWRLMHLQHKGTTSELPAIVQQWLDLSL